MDKIKILVVDDESRMRKLVKDFLEGINLQKATLNSKDFHDLKAPKCTFESLVNKNN